MFTLNCRGKLSILENPLVMGIINVTPDSFYAASRTNADNALRQVEQMLKEGADIIDVGAQSTRPDSKALSAEEELMRLDTLSADLVKHFPDTIFSIDSFYSQVAEACVANGFSIVNDISGGNLDDNMLNTVGRLRVPYICMHMRGTPQTMTTLNDYDNVTESVLTYFIEKIEACRKAGIHDVIIDPGFGFSKNLAQNFELLKNMHMLNMLNKPILAGLSRKSTIYKTLNISASEALNGTTVLNTIALQKGAGILRVHDVKEAKECISLLAKL